MEEKLWTKNFTLLCVIQTALTLSFYATMPVLPMFLEKDLGLTGLVMGIVTACYTITATLSRPFAGFFIDRIGRMPVLLPSFFIFGLLFLFYPLAASVLFIATLRLAHGIVWGTYMGAANTVAVDLVPASRRGEGIGIFGLCFSVTMALGPALGVALAGKFGFDTLHVISGIFLLVMFLPALKIRAPQIPLTVQPFSWNGLIEKTSLPLSLVIIFVYFSYGPMVNYTALYASTEISASAGIFFILLAAGMALARVIAGRSFDRRGPRGVMIVSFILLTAGFALQAMSRNAICFYVAALMMGLGFGIVTPVSQAMINSLVGADRRGAANATLMTALDTGICISTVLVGYMQAELGWGICLWSQVVGIVLGAVTFFGYALPHYHKLMAENRSKN